MIGEVMLELEHVDLKESEQNPVPISKEITPRSFKVRKRINVNEKKIRIKQLPLLISYINILILTII